MKLNAVTGEEKEKKAILLWLEMPQQPEKMVQKTKKWFEAALEKITSSFLNKIPFW